MCLCGVASFPDPRIHLPERGSNSGDIDSSGFDSDTVHNLSVNSSTAAHDSNKSMDTSGNEYVVVTEAVECPVNDMSSGSGSGSGPGSGSGSGSATTDLDVENVTSFSGSSSGGSGCCGDVVELCFTLTVTVLGEGRGEIFCDITCGDLHSSSDRISYDIISKEGVGSFAEYWLS